MQFVSKDHIENLLKDTKRLGAGFRADDIDRMCRTMAQYEFFMMASAAGQTRAEGVSVCENGDFICVMINTKAREPVSWAQQNFNNFCGINDSVAVICETLETVRKAYLRLVGQQNALAA